MIRSQFRRAVAVAALTFGLATPAVADLCDPGEPADIRISTRIDRIDLDTRFSPSDLRDLWQEGGNAPPHGLAGSMHLLGLYSAQHGARTRVQYRTQTDWRNRTCVGIAAVTVEIVLADRRIYVADILPRGSCPFETVLDHERAHAEISEAVVAETEALLEDALPDAAAALVPTDRLSAEATEEAIDRITDTLSETTSAALADAMAAGRLRHAALDEPERRAEERARCADDFNRIMRNLR